MKKFYKKEGFILKKFIISIEETLVKEFEVEAENTETAIKAAIKKYKKGEFELNPGELQFKQMAIVKPEKDTTEWFEF